MPETANKIRRALLSVSDKTGLVEFARFLQSLGVELISTGGTAKALREECIKVIDLSMYTGFPEMLDGRVKTLHPKVHGGLLYVRGNTHHEIHIASEGIKPIDLVACNLYPFEQTVAKPDVKLHEAIENIDIGGPSMLRSAAKNHDSVTVVVDPVDYPEVKASICENNGATTLELRQRLALKVFERTGNYDTAIAYYLRNQWRGCSLTLPRYPTRSTILHSQLTGKTYPTGFTAPLKNLFPDWKDLHDALKEGDWAVGTLLHDAGENCFPPTPKEILASSGPEHEQQIRYRSAMAVKALQFFDMWLEVVESWREDAPNWPPPKDIRTFFR